MTEGQPFLTGRSMIIAEDGGGVQFLAYPISRRALDRGGALINWVCQVPVSEPGPLTEGANWNSPGRSADVLPYYTGWRWSWLDVCGLITGSTEILEYPMVDRDPLPVWGRGRVTLLGDAAHPMYPVGANGASQAIIDARVLASALASCTDPIIGLAGYENARRGTTTGVVLANREMHQASSAVAGRAPQHLTRSGELAAITATYRRITGRAAPDLSAAGIKHSALGAAESAVSERGGWHRVRRTTAGPQPGPGHGYAQRPRAAEQHDH